MSANVIRIEKIINLIQIEDGPKVKLEPKNIKIVEVARQGPRGIPGPAVTFVSLNITEDITLTTADHFKRIYTTGATGTVNITLSDLEVDDEFLFIVREDFPLNIILDGQTLQLAPDNIASTQISNSNKGAVLHLWAESPTVLQALYQLGNWDAT